MADRTGIELARPGSFDLAIGGTQTFTPDMLIDAAARAQAQGGKFRAPLKLGHVDPRNDGEPAFGWLHNLRVEGTGDESVLLGDVTGMPQWLADTAPSAYPDRSIEGHVVDRADGTKGLQIEALALLGVSAPAMASLQTWRELPGFIAAAADMSLTAFAAAYEALRDAPQLPAEPVDPPPITKEAVTMTDTLNAGLRERLGVTNELDEAGLLAALDEALGEQATPPAVTAEAIAAAYQLTPAEVTARLTTAPIAAGAAVPAGSVLLSQDALDELRIAAAAGAQARAKQLIDERDETIGAAIGAGKIAKARAQHWATNWDKDPEGTKASIAELEVLYPIAASGYAGSGSGDIEQPFNDDEAAAMALLTGAPKEAFLA